MIHYLLYLLLPLAYINQALKCSKWEKRLGARRGCGGLVISSTYAEGFTFRKQRRYLNLLISFNRCPIMDVICSMPYYFVPFHKSQSRFWIESKMLLLLLLRKLASWQNFGRTGHIGGKDQGSVRGRHTCGILVCLFTTCIRTSTQCWERWWCYVLASRLPDWCVPGCLFDRKGFFSSPDYCWFCSDIHAITLSHWYFLVNIFLCKTNNSYSSEGRYMEIYNDPAMSLVRYSGFFSLENIHSLIEEYFQLSDLCYLSVRNSDALFSNAKVISLSMHHW